VLGLTCDEKAKKADEREKSFWQKSPEQNLCEASEEASDTKKLALIDVERSAFCEFSSPRPHLDVYFCDVNQIKNVSSPFLRDSIAVPRKTFER
jgi:hypothetical protein